MVAADLSLTGRCYCGATTVKAHAHPFVVTYCHCTDCKRSTGAPVAAFAGFRESDIAVSGDHLATAAPNPGAQRSFCGACGSPIVARYDYLPGQVYVPLGILDQAALLPPQLHAHADRAYGWLHLSEDLPRHKASSRTALNAAEGSS